MTEQYWQTKNGLVAVGDMTPDHLRNVLRQLIREKRILPPYKLKSAMLAEIEAEREDIHEDDYDSQWDAINCYQDWLSYTQ